MHKHAMFISLITVLVLSLPIFLKTTNLGFAGDEYLALLDYFQGNGKTDLFNMHFFLWQYGPPDTFFGFLYHTFGLQPAYFYIISYLLRLLASLSFYPLVKYLTENKLAGIVSSAFFSITFAGIETTNWAFNMLAYFSIFLLNMFFWAYLKAHLENRLRYFLLAVGLFFLTIVSAPTRMTGLIIFVVLFEIFSFIIQPKIKTAFFTILHLIVLVMAFLSIYAIGNSLANGETFRERIAYATKPSADPENSLEKLIFEKHRTDLLTRPLTQIGATLLPPNVSASSTKVIEEVYVSKNIIVNYFIFTLLVFLLVRTKILTTKLAMCALFLGLPASLISKDSFSIYPPFSVFYINILWTLWGSFLTIIFLTVLVNNIKNKTTVLSLLLGYLWIVSSIAIFWLRFPQEIQTTSHRYLISPVVGISLLLGILVSLAKTKKVFLIFIPILILISLHIKSTNRYLMDLVNDRNIKLSTNLRSSLPNIKDLQKTAQPNHPLVFYFKSDNPKVLYHNIMFGFPAIMSIQSDMSYQNLVYTENWAEIVQAHKTGSSLKRFSWPQKPVPLENIYAYQISGDSLIDITQDVRKKLSEEVTIQE